jgi:phage baseplate assembly protein gpV
MNRQTWKPIALASLLLAIPAAPCIAADYRVTRYDDPVPGTCLATDCSLREATIAASAVNDSDRILLSAGRYELSRTGIDEDAGLTGDLDVRGDVEILGASATMTVIDANDIDRVLDFAVFGGSGSPRLEDVSLTGGEVSAGGSSAISMATGTELTIERCEIHGNDNGGNSGGVVGFNVGSVLILRDSTLRDNIGGGVNVVQGEVQIFNSTFSNNDGSELQMTGATGYCNHCSFRDTIPNASAEVYVGSNSDLQLANTVVIGECLVTTGGSITSFGGNLESPGTGCDLDQATDQDGVASPGFGTLADNGGPTRTFLPSASSPAVSGANDALCPPTDQRGATRPDTNCDAGAVERVAVRPLTPLFADGFEQRNGGAWSLFVP